MNPPDDRQIDQLLRGQVKHPSPRFEAALRSVPDHAARAPVARWTDFLRPVAVAAAVLLGLSLFLRDVRRSEEEPQAVAAAVALDEQWIELLSLADALSGADSLSDDEMLPALEYYAFNQ